MVSRRTGRAPLLLPLDYDQHQNLAILNVGLLALILTKTFLSVVTQRDHLFPSRLCPLQHVFYGHLAHMPRPWFFLARFLFHYSVELLGSIGLAFHVSILHRYMPLNSKGLEGRCLGFYNF